MELPRWLQWDALQRTQFTYIRHAVIIAILTMTAAFGGLDSEPAFQTISQGIAYSNGPLKVTLLSLKVGCRTDMPPRTQMPESEGFSKVSLEALVQNTTNEDVPIHGYDKFDVFTLDGVDPEDLARGDLQDARQDVFRAGTFDSVEDIVAGLSMNIVVIWKVPDGVLAEIPTLTVRVLNLHKVQRAMLPTMKWTTTVPDTGGLLTLPKVKCE